MLFHDDVGCESETKRDIAADVDAGMLFFVPTSLGQPETDALSCRTGGVRVFVLAIAVREKDVWVVLSFQDKVPKLSKWVDEDKSNDWGDSDAGVS